MKLRLYYSIILLFTFFTSFSQVQTIDTSGMTFTPDTVTINLGDTVEFGPLGYHNAVEVDESTWIANDTTPNGGFYFSLGSPGGYFIADSAKTYYYVCQPHAYMGMKGVIIVNSVATYGCTDSTATNYNPSATIDDGSCIYPLPPAENLFFSEYAEGSSFNKYFEVYNPTSDTVDLTDYAFARVNNSPSIVGVYEFWNNFDSGAVILPYDVYIVAHPSADSLIVIEADMTFGSLSNGDDGFALVYGSEPPSPVNPDSGGYVILDWIGDWNGDPGSGWDVAGISNATLDHTLTRKCFVSQGDTNWILSAGTNPVNSQWIVLSNNNWSNIGQHTTSPCIIVYGCTDTIACDYDSSATIDDNSCSYPQTYTQNITICDGDSVIVGSSVYYSAGVYTDSILTLIGCDSIIETTVSIYSSSIFGGIPNNNIGSGGFYNSLQHLELNCYAPSELVSALIYAQDSNIIVFELRDNNGLVLQDTSYQVIPGVQRIYFNFEIPIATGLQLGISTSNSGLYRHNQGVSYPYNFGNLISLTGSSAGAQYYYFYYDIEIRPSFQTLQTISICDGETYQLGSSSYTVSGVYTDTLQSIIGCDSIVSINLIVLSNSSDSLFYTICSGQSVIIGNSAYDSTGIYIDTLIANNGCDSVVTTSVNVLTSSTSVVMNNHIICDGDSIVIDSNNVYYHTGTYSDTLINSVGCDSIIITHLTVQTPIYHNITICDGNSITVGSHVYDSTGTYSDTLVSSIGCDSVIHTNLTIYSQFNSIFGGIPNNTVGGGGFFTGSQHLEMSCYMPSELVSAVIYSADTTLTTFQIRDNNGNVLDSVTANIIPGGHRIYFNYMMSAGSDYQIGISGSSNDLFRNNAGVSYPYDFGPFAAVTSSSAGGNFYYFFYDIEVRQSSQPTNYDICDGESISVAGSIYNTTGFYTDSLTSSIGCDSLVFTHLVVYPNVSLTNNQTICSGEIYVINGNVYDSTGTYIDSLHTQYGCDSIVTTNLTVLTITGAAGVNPQTICLGDSASVGTSTYYTAGVYLDTLVSSNGCDSVVTTTLTILTANYTTYITGLPDTSAAPGGFSNYDGHLNLDVSAPSILKSATIYSEDTNSVTFELRDNNGVILDDVTHTVYPGSQSLIFNFALPTGNDFQLGVDGSPNISLFRSNAGGGNSLPYPFDIGALSITSANDNFSTQYYYYYYDIEIMPYGNFEEVYVCDGDSVIIAGNVYNTPGIYVDTFLSSNSCDSVLYTSLDFYQSPSLFIQSVPDPPEICLGDTVILEASSGFISYVWTNGATTHFIFDSPNDDQWYMVIAEDSNGCVSREDIMVYVDSCPPSWNCDPNNFGCVDPGDGTGMYSTLASCQAACVTSINESDIKNIDIYPNPSTGLFTVEFKRVKENNSNISIVNSIGNVVFSEELIIGEFSKQIDLSDFSKGIYLIEVQTEIGIYKKKIILQ